MPNNTVKMVDVGTAFFDHLKAASTFATLTGGRVYSAIAPKDPELPYAVVTYVDTIPMATFDRNGYESRVQVAMYASREQGQGSVVALRDALDEILTGVIITVTDHEQLAIIPDIERGPIRVDNLWRHDVDYILRGFRST